MLLALSNRGNFNVNTQRIRHVSHRWDGAGIGGGGGAGGGGDVIGNNCVDTPAVYNWYKYRYVGAATTKKAIQQYRTVWFV